MDTAKDEIAALREAHRYYRASVRSSWVFDYLYGRHLAGTISSARIGYAPGGSSTTTEHLRAQGFADSILEAAGISVRRGDGTLRDHLRDRLIIPVLSHRLDAVVGFLGRARPGDDSSPKYLNTGRTAFYDKGSELYGLAHSLDRLGRGIPALLVEGPLDKLALDHAAARGLPSVVPLAPCGTAITAAQLQLLARFSPAPILVCADGDEAGRRVATSVWETARRAIPGRPVSIVSLPADSDPAQLVDEGRYRVLADAIRSAQPAQHVALDRALADRGAQPAWMTATNVARRDVPSLPPAMRARYAAYMAATADLSMDQVTEILTEAISRPPPERLPQPQPLRSLRADPHPQRATTQHRRRARSGRDH